MSLRKTIWSSALFLLILKNTAFGVEPEPFITYYSDGHSGIVYAEPLYRGRPEFTIPPTVIYPHEDFSSYGDDDDDDGPALGIFKDGSLNIK